MRTRNAMYLLALSALLLALSIGSAVAAIQPGLDNVYGNAVVLSSGTQTIWDNSLTEAQFVAKLYATDAQQAEVMYWIAGEANWRPLGLSSTGTWADASATWKFVAPTGATFGGGTITLQAASIWGTTSASLNAGDSYSNSGWGTGGANTTYGSDTHDMGEWSWSTYTVNVPVGTSEFYVTMSTPMDYHTVWGSNMSASDISIVPEPSGLAVFGSALVSGLFGLARRKRQ